MAIANVISAIGNNSSVYPLIVRDCGIEVPTKIVMTYNQNKKEDKRIAYLAARERFLDEYSVSAVWLGGIPVLTKLCDYLIKKSGYNADVNLKLFNKDKFQGVDYNIEKFKNSAPEEIKDLIKVKNNKKMFEKLLAGKFILSTSIPILFMGFIIPKLIFASSARKIAEQRKKKAQMSQMNFVQKDKFISFKGNWIQKTANFSTQDKMAVTDGGYAVGRVATGRNKYESFDLAFKMAGMMFLNFVAPKWIEKGLDKMTGVHLDPIMLADKKFISAVRKNELTLPKSSAPEELFKFIDNIANKDSYFIKYAQKFEKLKMLKSGIRDPRAYVDVKKLGSFRDDMARFSDNVKNMPEAEFIKYIKKCRTLKTMNILTNVALSSFLLAYVLPKCQFAVRKIVTGSDLEPGLAPNKD